MRANNKITPLVRWTICGCIKKLGEEVFQVSNCQRALENCCFLFLHFIFFFVFPTAAVVQHNGNVIEVCVRKSCVYLMKRGISKCKQQKLTVTKKQQGWLNIDKNETKLLVHCCYF